METVVAAAVTGVFTLVGVWLTVRASRRASTQQHEDQTAKLVALHDRQHQILGALDDHRGVMGRLEDRVTRLGESHETLFGMVAELDTKVSKVKRNRISVEAKEVE